MLHSLSVTLSSCNCAGVCIVSKAGNLLEACLEPDLEHRFSWDTCTLGLLNLVIALLILLQISSSTLPVLSRPLVLFYTEY